MHPDAAATTGDTTVTIQANRMRTDDLGNFVANATTTIQATLSADGIEPASAGGGHTLFRCGPAHYEGKGITPRGTCRD